MWFTPLLSLLAQLPGVFGDYFKKKAEIANANIELQKAIVQAQMLQAKQMAQAQLEYQTTALNATMPLFKQRMFWFLSIPILYSIFYPSGAQIMWDNLRAIPEFYWSLYSAICLTIWGIPIASNMVSSVFNRFSDYQGAKRADKIELQKVSSEQYKEALAVAMRHVSPDGKISVQEWNKISAALDLMGEPPNQVKK